MGHREDGKHHVLFAKLITVPRTHNVGTEIPMAEHNALGLSGSTGSIYDSRRIHGHRDTHFPVTGVGGAVRLHKRKIFNVYNEIQSADCLRREFGELLLGYKNRL